MGNVSNSPQNAQILVNRQDIQYITYICNPRKTCSIITQLGTYSIDLFGRDMQSIENSELFTPKSHMSNSYLTANAYARNYTFPGIDQDNIANGWNFDGIHETINSLELNKKNRYRVSFMGYGLMPDFIDNSGQKYYVRDMLVDDFGNKYRKRTNYISLQKAKESVETFYLGSGKQPYSETNTTFANFRLSSNFDFTLDNFGNLIIVDDHKIFKAYHDGQILLLCGGEAGDAEGTYNEARFHGLKRPVVDQRGNIYVIDSGNHKIKKIDTTGEVSTIIGQKSDAIHSGDEGPASEATMAAPTHLAIDRNDNLYIGFGRDLAGINKDIQERIRVIDADGIIHAVAGEIGTVYLREGSIDASYAALNYLQEDLKLLIGPDDALFVGPYRIEKVDSKPLFDQASQTYRVQEDNVLKVFDTAFKHLQTLDTDTNTTLYTFSYNDANQLIAITDRYGETTQIRYTGGIATSIIAPNGDETTLHIDENRNLSGVTFPDGTTQSFEYNANDLMTAMIEPKGNRFEHEYDEHGRVVNFKDEQGGVWNYNYLRDPDEQSRMIKKTGAEGSERSQTFINRDMSTVIYEVDETGNERHITQSATTTTEKLCNIQMVSVPYGDEGTSTTISYLNAPLCFNNTRDYYPYSYPFEQILQNRKRDYIDENATLPQSISYTTTRQASIYIFKYYYKLAGVLSLTTTQKIDYTTNTLTQKSPAGREQSVTFNPLDMQPTKIEAEGLYPITLRYDSEGRLLSTKQESRETLYSYNAKGDLETSIDARGIPTYYTYDAMHRMISIKSEGIETIFAYDDNGNLISLSTPNAATFQTGHNANDAPTTQTSPLGHTTTYTYDKERRLSTITKPSGKSIAYTYKGKRIESITGDAHTTDFSYGCGSRLEGVSRDDGEGVSYAYEPTYNRMTSQSYQGLLDSNVSFEYAPYEIPSYSYYDIYNHSEQANALIYHLPVSITYAKQTQSLEYDKDGLLTKAGETTLTRDTLGRITKQSDTKGFSTTYTYNGYGEADDTITIHNTNTLFTQKILKRDEGGRILSTFEQLKGHSLPTITAYMYDRNGRLIEVQQDATITERYTYDNNGNRLSEEVNTTIGTYNQEDQLKSYGTTEYEYNSDGYLHVKRTATGTTTYEYGIFGELKSVALEDGTLITYQHNINHQRVAKYINGTLKEKYLWLNLTTLLATYDKDDKLITRYMYTSDRVPETMTTENNETYHLLYNHQGSLRAVVDSEGKIIKELQYDSFGNITLDTNSALHVNFGFAGGLYDKDTKLTRFGYRDYDAQTGKWTAKDPIGFDGGDTNLYGYVLGDPVDFVDPSGESFQVIVAITVGGGGLISYVYKTVKIINNASIALEVEESCRQTLSQLYFSLDQAEKTCSPDADNVANQIRQTIANVNIECYKLVTKYGGNYWIR